MNRSVYSIQAPGRPATLGRLLDRAGLGARLKAGARVLIKPNLVVARPPPITTPVDLVGLLVDYLRDRAPGCQILIGEGTGSIEYDTCHCFETLGYGRLARRLGVELVDLNTAPLVEKCDPACQRLPNLFLPKILDEVFLVSVPVLKAHSLAGVTLSLKNMMGCLPPVHYRVGNSWGKSAFHRDLARAIVELNRYRAPDFTLLEATVGMAESHLSGRRCEPPVGRLVAGWDPVAVDSYGCRLLGRSWRDIGHLRLAHGLVGQAEPLDLVDCGEEKA